MSGSLQGEPGYEYHEHEHSEYQHMHEPEQDVGAAGRENSAKIANSTAANKRQVRGRRMRPSKEAFTPSQG
jgi:hypothetical protein